MPQNYKIIKVYAPITLKYWKQIIISKKTLKVVPIVSKCFYEKPLS